MLLHTFAPLENEPVLFTKTSGICSCKNPSDFLHDIPPMDENTITCTLPNGRRFFMKMARRPRAELSGLLGLGNVAEDSQSCIFEGEVGRVVAGGGGGSSDNSTSGNGLLREPIQTLMERVERQRVALAVKRAEEEEKAKLELSTEREPSPFEVSQSPQQNQPGSSSSAMHNENETFLWVNKYAPSTFTQLLSDERANREVLRAVKGWDAFVFGGQAAAAAAPPRPGDPAAAAAALAAGDGPRDLRPQTKVILLAGAPGTGKTTLAHVVARHAGYQPLEVNASDHRSARELRELLGRALGSRREAFGGGARPTALVLDELLRHLVPEASSLVRTATAADDWSPAFLPPTPKVDGIAEGPAAMKVLLDIAQAPLRAGGGSGGKGKKGGLPPLTRPLILICNDLYAPQLRKLRQIAKVFSFKETSEDRLMKRLRVILKQEKMDFSHESLRTLCQTTSNDIRSCLNTLQFVGLEIKNNKLKGMTSSGALFRAIENGIKDGKRSIFEVWNSMYISSGKNRSRPAALQKKMKLFSDASSTTAGGSAKAKPAEEIMDLVERGGEAAKVLAGAHEHLPLLRHNDPTLVKAAAAINWLAAADLAQFRFPALGWAAAGALHLLLRADAAPRLELPRADYLHGQELRQKRFLLQQHADACRTLAVGRTLGVAALDALGPLMDMLTPSIQAVNLDLMKPADKEKFSHLVKVLASCNLTYKLDSESYNKFREGEEGAHPSQARYLLEPDLGDLLRFGGAMARPRATLAATVAQMAAQAANYERLRRLHGEESPGEAESNKNIAPAPTEQRGSVPQQNGEAAAATEVPEDLPKTTSVQPSSAKTKDTEDASSSAALGDTLTQHFKKRAPSGRGGGEGPAKGAEGRPSPAKKAKKAAVPWFQATAREAAGGGGAAPAGGGGVGRGGGSGGGAAAGGGAEAARPRLVYKFKKGFTNAVRRPVHMKDLLMGN